MEVKAEGQCEQTLVLAQMRWDLRRLSYRGASLQGRQLRDERAVWNYVAQVVIKLVAKVIYLA